MTEVLRVAAGRAAGLISVVGFIPYALAVVRGRARPNQATWIIWTAVGVILVASFWATGARASIWVPASYAAGPFVTALLALKYGERGFTRFDKGCLAAAAASLVLWGLTGNPLVALALNVLVDLLGALPTVHKAWGDPGSEDRLAWTLFFAGNGVNLAAIEVWTVAGAGYPVYLFLLTMAMNALLWRPRGAT